MSMLCFIIWFIFIIFEAEGQFQRTVNPVPRFNSPKQEIKLTVVRDEPLIISLENFDPKDILCQKYYATKEIPIKFEFTWSKYNDTVYIKVPKVTDEMSTHWTCKIERRVGKPSYIFLLLHVKGAVSVKLTVNDKELALVRTNLTVKEFDSYTHYSYVDGETVDLTCSNLYNSGYLRLRYYDDKGNLQFETDGFDFESLNFQSTMTIKHNNYFIDCTYTSYNPYEDYNYRTYFFMKRESEKKNLIVKVNDRRLLPIKSNSKKFESNYNYQYIEGDTLNVTCEKRKPTNNKLGFFFYQENNIKARIDSSRQISTALQTYTDLNKKTLVCREKEGFDAKILLLTDKKFTGIRLLRLPYKNVLYQYTTKKNHSAIIYQYKVNETLDLACVSRNKSKELQWTFRNEILSSDTDKVWNITRKFSLEAIDNGSSIKCINRNESPNEIIDVLLYLNPKQPSGKPVIGESDENIDNTEFFVILGSAFGVMIVLITAMCMVCRWRRKKNANLIQNEYENFSNSYSYSNNVIPAFPSQWENHYVDLNYAQIRENMVTGNHIDFGGNDQSYEIVDRRHSNINESHYTEIDDNFKSKNNTFETPSSTRPHNNHVLEANTGAYDELRRSYLHVNNPKQNSSSNIYNRVSNTGKNKSVSFKQNNCRDLRYENCINSLGKLSQDRSKNKSNTKQNCNSNSNSDNATPEQEYAVVSENIREVSKRGNQNHTFVENEKNVGDGNLYAEPYYDIKNVDCVNELYES